MKKKIIYSLCVILFIACLGITCYLKSYYHVEEDVTLENAIEQTSDRIVIGDKEAKIGFIFYPGGKVQFEAYAPLLETLCQKKMMCILVHMPVNLAVFDTHVADEIMEEYPNVEKWYVGGHSLGGAVASMCVEKHSEKFAGLILLASYSSKDISKTNIPVLSIYGSKDGVLNREKYEKNKANLPKNVKEFVIEGGNHAYFGNYGEQKGDGQATISREDQQKITAQHIIRFLQEVSYK